MKQLTLAIALVFALITAALAHSPVNGSTPKDGSTIASVPEALVMTFANPARVTKVTLTHKTATASHPTDLEISSKGFVKKISFTPVWKGAGDYVVEWRALGDDGHPMKGSFSFIVTGE